MFIATKNIPHIEEKKIMPCATLLIFTPLKIKSSDTRALFYSFQLYA